MTTPSSESAYRLELTWFALSRDTELHPVADIDSLRRLLASHRDAERLAVYLERDEGERGSLWVHLTDERAWVTHWEQVGGPDSYCRDAAYRGTDEMVGFLLPNGQEDEIHRAWTVSRVEGLNALEFFFLHGERDPSLTWEQEPETLQEPF